MKKLFDLLAGIAMAVGFILILGAAGVADNGYGLSFGGVLRTANWGLRLMTAGGVYFAAPVLLDKLFRTLDKIQKHKQK
ncbi:MAG: hypothetical protein FWB93_02845 [Oscillospiraceae bacterium]|nr:hypothetical protein [Oscillospiraceae bacterium]